MARFAALVVIGTVLGTAGLGRAQSLGGAEGLVIGSVRYDPPERDRRADEDAGLPVGSVLTGAAVRRAIRAIWSLHRYSDVRILVDRTPDGRVDVIVRTSLIARVAEISVRGNLALSRDQVVRGAAVRL